MQKKYSLIEGELRPVEDDRPAVRVFVDPDSEEKAFLGSLGIGGHTLASALDPDELSRLEIVPSHAAVVFKRPKNYSSRDNYLFRVASCGLFLFKDLLVVVIAEDVAVFDKQIFARIGSLNELFLKILYRMVFHFLEHLKVIGQVSDDVEKKINSSMQNRYLLNLFTLSKSLVYYVNAISSNDGVIGRLGANPWFGFTQSEAAFLEDLVIENRQCLKTAEISSDVLANLMDARASLVNNNLNVLMKTLNLITICIMVPTFVVSAFSMNVVMPFSLKDLPAAFWIILGLAALSVVLLLFIIRSKKW